MKVPTFKFDIDFMTGKVVPIPIFRMYLKSGNMVQGFFYPTGLTIILPERCKDNGDIIWVPTIEMDGLGGFGSLKERKEKK